MTYKFDQRMHSYISYLNTDAKERQSGQQRRPRVLDTDRCQVALGYGKWIAMSPQCYHYGLIQFLSELEIRLNEAD